VSEPDASRAILHVDMDAFFASVELLRRPELRGRPVAVGGTGDRGVIAAASYEARVYGVRSAMPSARARRLCPDLVLLPGDHAHYAEVSGRIMDLFRSVTPLVEPLSLDEAFLDVTGTRRLHGPPAELAATLRRRVLDQEGLHCAVGVAPNKFLAKLASEQAKPTVGPEGPRPGAGVVVVPPGGELDFLHPLDVSRLWGVGPATLAKLQRFGIRTVGDLATLPRETVIGALGRGVGEHLHALAHGLDDRPVVPDQEPKSISHEETFPADRHDPEELRADVVRMADAVADRLRRHGYRGRTVQLKVRYADFTTVTRSRTLPSPTDRGTTLRDEAWRMLAALPVERGVRLLGVGAANLTKEAPVEQLSLDELVDDGPGAAADWDAANRAVDDIRRRFGAASIGPGRITGGDRTRPHRPWGPDRPSGAS
jgi:DNA polymerase-4